MRYLISIFLLLWTVLAGADEFLDPAVAFKPSVRVLDPATLEISFDIAKGYYLYRDKFRFVADGTSFGPPVFPKGKEKLDENYGKVEVYFDTVAIRLPLLQKVTAPLALAVTSQGCAEGGICYPPQIQKLSVSLPPPDATPSANASNSPPNNNNDESGRIAQTLRHASFWANMAFFFIAGLGLALTPCVFPMIPILSSIIAGQGHRLSRRRGLALSLAYVLGMAITYALAGVAAGLTGTLISGLLQNAWVLGSFALLFGLLALSMFGFYELQLPSALQSKLSEEAGHFSGGRGLGVFVMGALSALIVGPCVAAPLAGALLYIGQTGDAWFGGAALFVLALGMGAPLIAVGVSAGALLPRAGPWMEAVKRAFGVVLLGTAWWLLTPLLPAAAVIGGWAVLFILPAIYLHALDPLPPQAHGWQRFWKGIGIILLLTGAALLLGALAGARDPLQPLAGLRASGNASAAKLPFERVATLDALEARIKHATKPVMLDFYADWCVSCKEMERDTFADPAIRARLGNFLLLQADVTANSDADRALLARFGLYGPPGIIFFDTQGREIAGLRVVGFQDAPNFNNTLDAAGKASAS